MLLASHVGNYVPRDLRHGYLRFAAGYPKLSVSERMF